MQARHTAEFEALIRAQLFLTRNSAAVGLVNQSRACVELDVLVDEIRTSHTVQRAAADHAIRCTDRKTALRWALYSAHLRPIADIVRAKLAQEGSLTYLRGLRWNVDDARLAGLGMAMTESLAPFTAVFLEARFPADFVAQLRAAVEAYRQGIIDQRDACGVRASATSRIVGALRQSRLVMPVLHALVVRQLRGEPVLLAVWQMARQIKRPSERALEPRVGDHRRKGAHAGGEVPRALIH